MSFRGFLQSYHHNAGIVTLTGYGRLVSRYLQFIYPFDAK